MISVQISGKAWFSQMLASDPGYDFSQVPDLKALKDRAQVMKRGRGHIVLLRGEIPELEHLAEWYECDGDSWAHHSGPEDKPEGRACLEAARAIRAAIKENTR